MDEAGQSLAEAEHEFEAVSAELARHERETLRLAQEIENLRNENEASRKHYVEQMRAAAALGSRGSAIESELAAARRVGESLGVIDHLRWNLEAGPHGFWSARPWSLLWRR